MLRISVRELQVFATVARHMSFARAAEELHVSPPAVSMQVAALEATLEVPLFERAGGEFRSRPPASTSSCTRAAC